MNKLDKQFEQIMKGAKIDSPSDDFRVKVMSRISAEAAVTRRLIQDYKPVISRPTWIFLIGAFAALVIYILFEGFKTGPSSVDQRVLTTMAESVSKMNTSLLNKVSGLFSSIPTVAYLIILASLSLWTLDSFLSKLKFHSSRSAE